VCEIQRNANCLSVLLNIICSVSLKKMFTLYTYVGLERSNVYVLKYLETGVFAIM
jgi:hypothetical protein